MPKDDTDLTLIPILWFQLLADLLPDSAHPEEAQDREEDDQEDGNHHQGGDQGGKGGQHRHDRCGGHDGDDERQ